MANLMFTFGSLLFIILLIIVYFTKEKFLSMKNKIYRIMLILSLTLAVTETLYIFSILYSWNHSLALFLCKINWFNGFLFLTSAFYYGLCLIRSLNTDTFLQLLKTNGLAKVMFMFTIVFTVGFFFVPFTLPSKDNLTRFPGFGSYYVLLYGIVVIVTLIVLTLLTKKKNNFNSKGFVLTLIGIMIITYFLQYIFKNVSIITMASVIAMYLLYFIVENSDLKIINNIEKEKEEIEKSNKAKSDFLSNMSHEIRSPMNAIIGFSSTLLSDEEFDEDSVRSDIKNISNAGNSLLDIINNILDISKIESGKETLNMKEYSLASIIMELSSIIESRIGNNPIKFITDVDNNIPSKLYGDSTKIFQILLNILVNSVKYTEVGRIKLSVQSDTVMDKVNLHIKVSDTGYGIKKDDYDKLFEKFSRLDTATEKEIEGTGLGLVITKKYVDLMGGKIWFESEYQVGTTFYVDITQKIVDKKPIGTVHEPIKEETKLDYIDCSKYKVLIVDDNKLNLKVASRLLEDYKFNIEMVESGKECIYKVKEGNKYDMIFMDHMMPEMDGIETLHVIRKLKDYSIPPVVALTANAITGMKEMYLKEGFDEYLSKPINISELNKLILKYFNKKKDED